MGRVSAFLGMVLYMYPEKNGRHNRPHVHVLYGDDECVLSVPEGEVLAGSTRKTTAQCSDIHRYANCRAHAELEALHGRQGCRLD